MSHSNPVQIQYLKFFCISLRISLFYLCIFLLLRIRFQCLLHHICRICSFLHLIACLLAFLRLVSFINLHVNSSGFQKNLYVRIDTPLPEGRGFLFHRVEPKPHNAALGFTDSPQANAVSPTAFIFFAAFTSRSWLAPHSGQTHERTLSAIFDMV